MAVENTIDYVEVPVKSIPVANGSEYAIWSELPLHDQ